MSIDWQSIKSFNNSQNNAFEELVCQIAREEPIADKKEFYRIAAPDGGVEAYCILANGEEYGWQAKYFQSIGSSQWSQVKKSFETALKTHPNLTRYFICIPLDRQDPRHDNQMWFMDEWNKKTQEWIDYANTQGRRIAFEYWGSSELIHRLSEQKHAGRKLFWFSKEEFSDDWFRSHTENSIQNLGHRYTPTLNFELDIAKYFDSLSRSKGLYAQLERELHDFFKEFRKLDEVFFRKTIVKDFLDGLLKQLELAKSIELIRFDIDSIQEQRKSVENLLREYRQDLRAAEKELSKDLFDNKMRSLYRASDALDKLKDFIAGQILILANYPIMLLSGEAGIGKSHLLADIASKKINENKACIFLLGQHFGSKEAPWTQILNNFLRLKCNEAELLGALNAKAQAQGERLLFIVDAINEGEGRYFWPDHIRGFINNFTKYPWLGLVLSVRSSYENLMAPVDRIPNRIAIRVVHYGFETVEYQACSFFFSQYDIEQPTIPLLHPEFGNPLFLKLFCEGLYRSGQKRIPKGYSGITSVIDFFLSSVDEKLSIPAFFDYQPASSKKVVRKVINALIQEKLQNDNGILFYESAVDIANNIISKYSSKKGFVDNLISEGVLSKNIYWKNPDEEVIYFAYERFEDHLTAAYLLDDYLGQGSAIDLAFCDGGKFSKYIVNSNRYQGIIEALSIQLPEKIDWELYELVPDEKISDMAIIEAFIKSLIWRQPESIKEKTKSYVNQYILKRESSFDLFFQMIYTVSSDPNHLFNAKSLHRCLMQFSLADRDALWTTYLHDRDYEGSSMQRLIDWALQDGNKGFVSPDSASLAGTALAWLFTSTNIRFRDSATKALVCLLENNLPTVTKLLTDFNDVNDPYVYERILASAYGAVVRSDNLDGLTKLAAYILNCIFQKDEVYPNVLVRDYSRNIIEYAIYKKCFTLENHEIIRPPYKSDFPNSFPSNEEIDAYKFDYELNDSKKYWGQNAILNSMVTEYGRGVCRYGDFGRYTFESALSDWEYILDANYLSNYACKLIFKKYGYDVNKHGDFDSHASSGDRHTNKKERIGKKYQWMALYEVLARVADTHKMLDASTSWGKDKRYVWYQGAWECHARNIDPTLICNSNTKLLSDCSDIWFKEVEYSDWNGGHQTWLISHENLPNPEDIIALTDAKGNEWVVFETSQIWDEPVPVGYESYEYPHKNIWYSITSYFVREAKADNVITWAKQQHFRGQQLPESSEQYRVFSREYYWSPAYHFFDNPYYGRSQWIDISDSRSGKKDIGKVMVTTERHRWESGSDYREQPSYLAPREYMYKKMELQYSNNIGEWLDSQSQVACFDPSVNYDVSSCLLVRRDILQKFLHENHLKIFWICQGEKRILGDIIGGRSFEYKEWLEISGVFTLNKSGIDGNIKPLIKSINP